MSDITRAMPVQGWYPDPGGSALMRWWSGMEWTAHTLDPMTGQPPVAYQPIPSHSDYASSYSSAATHSTSQRTYAGTPTLTIAIMVLGIYPIVYSAVLWAAVSASGKIDAVPIGIVGLVTLTVIVGMAFWDSSVLKKRGIPAASALWIFLSPLAYFIARRVRLKELGIRANAPGNVFVVSALAAGALAATVGTSVVNGIIDKESISAMQTSVATTLASKTSTHWTVNCPEDAPAATVGAVFTCHATDTSGKAVDIRATVISRDRFSLTAVTAQATGATT